MVNSTLRTHLSLLLLLFGELLLAHSGGLMSAVAMAATATVAAAVTLCTLVVHSTGPLTPTRIRTAMRDRELRTAFLAQRDPDARGRRRPRAPGRPLPTAA
ncbi:DUF6412 domain-containing protein [Streptomyces sp. NPDC001262]|uniref:DUF6412 domain-containing protein n=1 Tax=unclassified Streptomyces TaxID=2593676 RepID=UPI00368B6BBE